MIRTLAAGALLVLAAASACPAATRACPSALTIARIRRIAAAEVDQRRTAGLAVGLACGGRTLLDEGFGLANLETRTPVSPASVFRIGSVTKQFTAAAVVILADRGRLSVRDRLSKFLPDFPRGGEVTLQNLLQHTSGIHNYTSDPSFRQRMANDASTEGLVGLIASQPHVFDFEPGSRWEYSNSNYILLGAVIEKVSGRTLREFLGDTLFRPLGMANTDIDDAREVLPDRVNGYSPKPGGSFLNAPFISMTIPGGAGAARSTIADLLRWEAALTSARVVSEAGFEEMATPARLTSRELVSAQRASPGVPAPQDLIGAGVEYGYGLTISTSHGVRDIGHAGGIPGFSAQVDAFPDRRTALVILSNTDGAAKSISDRIKAILFDD